MLKVGGCDDDGVDVFHRVKLIRVARFRQLLGAHRHFELIGLMRDEGRAFFAPLVPDVADGDGFKVQRRGESEKSRDQRIAGAVARPDYGDAYAVVSAKNPRIARGPRTDRYGRRSGYGRLQEISS